MPVSVPPTKALDLTQLQTELAAAGVIVPAVGSYVLADNSAQIVHTYDGTGTIVDFAPAQIAAVATAVTAHAPSTTQRDQLVSILQSTVGVAIVDLTQVQIKALIAGLIYKQGGLTRQNLIRPLNQWLI